MQINTVADTNFQAKKTVIINGRKYIPLKNYKGPTLELTFWEEEEVKNLRKEIVLINTECFRLQSLMNAKNVTGYMKNQYSKVLMHYNKKIESLTEQIRTIQKNRFDKQKSGTTGLTRPFL